MIFRTAPAAALGLALTLGLVACTDSGRSSSDPGSVDASPPPSFLPQPTRARLEAAGLGDLPVARASERVDIATPTFSNPTEITNPLFPISDLRSAILSGRVDGTRFHTETTLLPETRLIEWTEGETVETRVSQYVAYLDGRIQEGQRTARGWPSRPLGVALMRRLSSVTGKSLRVRAASGFFDLEGVSNHLPRREPGR